MVRAGTPGRFGRACLVVGLLASTAPLALAQAVDDPLVAARERGRSTGPAVASHGQVFAVDDPTMAFAPGGHRLRVVFEAFRAASSPDRVNAGLNSVARFLNMSTQAGVPLEDLDVALVIHGKAAFEALDHDGYRRRFDVDNPNVTLLAELRKAGVDIYVCAQSMAGRSLGKHELASSVDVAFAAMTALAMLKAQGYQSISPDWGVPRD